MIPARFWWVASLVESSYPSKTIVCIPRCLRKFEYFLKMTLNDSPFFQSQHHNKVPPSATRTVFFDSTGNTPSNRNCLSLEFWAVHITPSRKGTSDKVTIRSWSNQRFLFLVFFQQEQSNGGKGSADLSRFFQHRYWCWSINFEGLWSACSFWRNIQHRTFHLFLFGWQFRPLLLCCKSNVCQNQSVQIQVQRVPHWW